jgi:DivIVA domain-containing protein
MIDLTPLDVRKKRGDFKKTLRGYDSLEVDGFLELVAERMEELVKANLTLEERAQRLGEQVVALGGRERAVNEALVTAQQLRDEIRDQAQRESEQIRREAERESAQLLKEAERDAEHLDKESRLQAKELVAEAERQLEERKTALAEIESQRMRFLDSYRHMLHRQMELVQVEESRSPLDDVAVELDLGGGRGLRDQGRASFTFDSDASEEWSPDEAEVDGMTRADEDREAAARALFAYEVEAPPQEEIGETEGPTEVVDDEREARVDALDDAPERAAEAQPGRTTAERPAESDEAIPVEGLAPTPDDVDHEATILPAPRVGA